ncbi:Hpt domain-containing protein [Dyadobacter sp. Leaf189]|uniref:Hpt domain-containing protein n=1 Tax=Dyadobacter sp. Leaf189 TaxID=1736295 RepID=UPI000ABB45CB|nr:Hpt domain-containing protein [Dyadobacter sp. Leaf189]
MNNSHDETSLIDFAYLQEITGGDAELKSELISMFESETVIQLDSIRTNCKAGDLDMLKQSIHKYRSSLFSVGLLNTAAKYKEIESALKRNETVPDLAIQLADLELESNAGLEILKSDQ